MFHIIRGKLTILSSCTFQEIPRLVLLVPRQSVSLFWRSSQTGLQNINTRLTQDGNEDYIN